MSIQLTDQQYIAHTYRRFDLAIVKGEGALCWDDSGKEYIVFGQLYEGKRFESYGDLMNHAKVENHFFRELLEDL